MAAQTAVQTSVLQKILAYFELASKVAEVVPKPHVQAIAMLVDTLSADLIASPIINSPHEALQTAATNAQKVATIASNANQPTNVLSIGPASAYAPDIAKGITEPIGAKPGPQKPAQPQQTPEQIMEAGQAASAGKMSSINLDWLMAQPEPGRSSILAEYGLKLS